MNEYKVNEKLKNKARAPAEASMVHDSEGLKEQLEQLKKEYKILLEDSK